MSNNTTFKSNKIIHFPKGTVARTLSKPAVDAFAQKSEEIAKSFDATAKKFGKTCSRFFKKLYRLALSFMRCLFINYIVVIVFLAIREHFPDVAAQVPTLYKFVDGILIPLYEFVMKCVHDLYVDIFQISGFNKYLSI